jgi:lyso-ornithine lipid O-acyltransferase
MIAPLRAGLILAAFFVLTLSLMPVQALLLRTRAGSPSRPAHRHFPHWYHRQLCRLLGVRLHVDGAIAPGTPTLLLANHVSWLDIPVLSAVAPVSFVAKREVSTWPFVRTLARLQRTIFVDRQRRHSAGPTASEIERRLALGDTIVLFPEGTSNDGNQVLPFRSALIAAAGVDQRREKTSRAGGGTPGVAADGPAFASIEVRTLSLAYTHLHGIALDRFQRPTIAWYGGMELSRHVWTLIGNGPLDVHIRIGAPLPLAQFKDRKALARHGEQEVRRVVAGLLRSAGG